MLDLRDNSFCGELTFDTLPAGMRTILLQSSFFEGEFAVRLLPEMLRNLNASSNNFKGAGIVYRAFWSFVQVKDCYFDSVVDENGKGYEEYFA